MKWETIIQRLKGGDYNELEKVYIEYREEFFHWLAKHYNCSYDDMQDIYQQSILIMYENIVNEKVVNFTGSVKTYLFAIGKNKYYELNRSMSKQSNDEMINLASEPDKLEEMEESDLQENKLAESLAKLGEPCKSLLEYYYYHNLSMQDIADKLGLKNTDTAKNMKYKCLKRLRTLFTEDAA